jgi:hypothetical protein
MEVMIKHLLPQSVLNWYDDNKELLIVVAGFIAWSVLCAALGAVIF